MSLNYKHKMIHKQTQSNRHYMTIPDYVTVNKVTPSVADARLLRGKDISSDHF